MIIKTLINELEVFIDSDVIESIAYENAVYHANLHKPEGMPPMLEKAYLEAFVTAWVYSYNHTYEELNDYL